MPPQYTSNHSAPNGQEKSPLAGQPGPSVGTGAAEPFGFFSEGSTSLVWPPSSLADCFPNFSMCQPCSGFEPQPAYQPLPTGESYDYDSRRPPSVDTSMLSMQPQGQDSLISTPITPDPATLFACGDPALMTQYLSGYPSLRPTQVMEAQPATRGEEMVYPETSPVAKYDGISDSPRSRIRCNLDPEDDKGPCLSCKKIATTTRVYRLSCLRWKITDVKLFKPGQVKEQEWKWTDRWKDSVMDDIGSWDSPRVRIIHVTEGYTGKSVRLRVRQFQPQAGDRLKRSWVSSNGKKNEVEIPPYAIVDMEGAKAALDEYIKLGLLDCCNNLLRSRDKLLRKTYALAMKTAMDPSTPELEQKLLLSTLDLWMSVRLTTKSFEIVGDDTLDMPRDVVKDKGSPLYGKIPLPPVMGAQIDSVLIHQIQPQLRRRTLEELQKMTQEKKQKTWLTTYLVTFILLHNIALITKHDAEYAKKHDMKRRFAREANVKEYNLGANTLLAYFHYCNKAVYPFAAECKDQDLRALAELDEEAISFVHFIRQFAAEHKKEWEGLWLGDAYEHEYYYVSQLFEHGWQPRIMA
ncbi:Tetratricopeptide repeat domain containing protein [Madurella fahalii]|uniref:Tetratricopeptide repeat domain containing protein n=1 Tax=Madurella fahalii TaxID=1157608 RepID=A0ABQ0FX44_9PEZI